MLFNSYEFLFLFLPITWAGYFLLHRGGKHGAAMFWILIASFVFYTYWNPAFLLPLLVSVVTNYIVAHLIARAERGFYRRFLLVAGIAFNLALLGYFKYADFFLENVNAVFGSSFNLLHLLLPLGISFFTFQQIAYLVDVYKGEVTHGGWKHYALFVAFFPQLIAGPIVHHKEMMPQFADSAARNPHYQNIALGIFILVAGLFKKVILADSFALWANAGFDSVGTLSFVEAWITSVAFSLQLYFDFSAYSDMAIGIGLLFNIRLPLNFDSPYKSRSLQEFWRRWHITLSRFLRDYLYIPLGGSRKGGGQTALNLLIVFVLGGLWHGAGWTFVIWGLLNGIGLIIGNLWARTKLSLGGILSQIITLLFVNAAWVFFRAPSLERALDILASMINLNGITLPASLAPYVPFAVAGDLFASVGESALWALILVGIGVIIALFSPNVQEIAKRFQPTILWLILALVLLAVSLYRMNDVTEFIYFNF